MEILKFIRWFFSSSWDFFTETQVPGMGFSFAALFVGIFLAVLSLRLLGYMFGFGSITSQALLGLRNPSEKDSGKK